MFKHIIKILWNELIYNISYTSLKMFSVVVGPDQTPYP